MTTDAAYRPIGDLAILEVRPGPGRPREYHFPRFERARLGNGLTVITADLPGRMLLAAQLIMEGGAGLDPDGLGGATTLMARALTEGTRRRSAIELVEATERLGAELHADAGWETTVASVEVPRSRFAAALELLAEMVREPSFPPAEVERLRDERLNDLLQAMADPRRRVERAFAEAIYAPDSPFSRPSAGTPETVARIDRDVVVARHAQILDPSSATLIVVGDLTGVHAVEVAERLLGDATGTSPKAPSGSPRALLRDTPNVAGRGVTLVDRPGASQTQIRVGHVGLSRSTPDFHAVSVMSAILGGLFNSRLQRLLREERGYTYGVGAGFDFRRSAGPFAVRTAVQTQVTVPAVRDIVGELQRISAEPPDEAEVADARDYLVGVFPLRFEGAQQVAAAISGLVVFGLPDDELDRYRPAVAAVTPADVATATSHVRLDDLSFVLVGDAAAIEADLRAAGIGEVRVIRDDGVDGAAAAAAPLDDGPEDAPTSPAIDGPEPPGPVPPEPWPDEPQDAGLDPATDR